MTLPSASTLTDEQLRVLCAEARGFIWYKWGDAPEESNRFLCEPIEKPGSFIKCARPSHATPCNLTSLPDPLHDANAALRLLDKYQWWEVLRDDGLVNGIAVTVYKEGEAVKHFMGVAPDFCRAAVLAFLRAEGKIL